MAADNEFSSFKHRGFTKPLVAFWLILLATVQPVTAKDAVIGSLKVCMISSDLFPLWRKPGQENQSFGGVNIDMMREIAGPLNLRLEWVRAPFARCLYFLQSGAVDVLNVASYSREREQYGVFPTINGEIDTSRRFKLDTYYAFVTKHSKVTFNGEEFSHLSNRPIATEIKASVIPRLLAMGVELLQQPQAEFSFLMLARGRVSAVVTNQYNGLKYMREGIKRLEPAVQEKPYYLLFSRQYYHQHQDKVEQMWRMSGQMQSHRYPQILQQYASMPHWPH